MERRQFCRTVIAALGMTTITPAWAAAKQQATPPDPSLDSELARRMQEKIENYDQNFADDIILGDSEFRLMRRVLTKLSKTQSQVGFGHFNLMSFDELLLKAAATESIGALTPEELAFIEKVFFTDARTYGFYGEKITPSLTATIDDREVIKIPGSGHYLFRGKPEEFYKVIVREVGSNLVLTSGIRSVVKQLHLFFAKALACQGNLSKASRSLAPPGHSYHGISDFDVGKHGWGHRNFSDQFAETDIFKRLTDLGYVDIRYHRTNPFGVRFEPWHIKVG